MESELESESKFADQNRSRSHLKFVESAALSGIMQIKIFSYHSSLDDRYAVLTQWPLFGSCEVNKVKCVFTSNSRIKIQHCGCNQCVYLAKMRRLICITTYLGHQVTSRDPWSEVKFWRWPFMISMQIFRRVLTRGTRWHPNCVTTFVSSKIIWKKTFSPKTTILAFLDLYRLTRSRYVNSDDISAKRERNHTLIPFRHIHKIIVHTVTSSTQMHINTSATVKWCYFSPFRGFFSMTHIIDSPTMIKYFMCVKHSVLKLWLRRWIFS